MPVVNSLGYLIHARSSKAKGRGDVVKRDWWMIKCVSDRELYRGYVEVGIVGFPKHLLGRKVRFKVELLPEEVVV